MNEYIFVFVQKYIRSVLENDFWIKLVFIYRLGGQALRPRVRLVKTFSGPIALWLGQARGPSAAATG